MIRITYSWKVESGKVDEFVAIWKKTTNTIHEEVQGARGSLMIQHEHDPTEIKTIARWDTLDD